MRTLGLPVRHGPGVHLMCRSEYQSTATRGISNYIHCRKVEIIEVGGSVLFVGGSTPDMSIHIQLADNINSQIGTVSKGTAIWNNSGDELVDNTYRIWEQEPGALIVDADTIPSYDGTDQAGGKDIVALTMAATANGSPTNISYCIWLRYRIL